MTRVTQLPRARPAGSRRTRPAGKASAKGGGSAPLARAARIVDVVSGSREGLSLQQISEALDLPPSTTHRLVRSLVGIGYLVLDRDRRTYRVGQRLVRLIHMRMGTDKVQSLVEPILMEVVQQFHQVCYLTQLLGEEVRLVAYSLPENAGRTLIYPGEISLIHAMATGKVTFAFQEQELVERHLARPLAKLQKNTQTDPDEVRRELAQVRKQGYAVTDSEFELGVFAVACPVTLPDAGVIFAIGVAGFRSQMFRHHKLADYVGTLKRAADEAARVLAYADIST
jgi:DNA-binding IclR family transcriptional regulator